MTPRHLQEPVRQQADVEAEVRGAHVDRLLLRGKQIDQQGREPGLIQQLGDIAIARAEAAAAAAMGEQHHCAGTLGKSEVALERDRTCVDADGTLFHGCTLTGLRKDFDPAALLQFRTGRAPYCALRLCRAAVLFSRWDVDPSVPTASMY